MRMLPIIESRGEPRAGSLFSQRNISHKLLVILEVISGLSAVSRVSWDPASEGWIAISLGQSPFRT
jgi:hypothetical protein